MSYSLKEECTCGTHCGKSNISRAREFYEKYREKTIKNPISDKEIHVIASAINYLIIRSGGTLLKYKD